MSSLQLKTDFPEMFLENFFRSLYQGHIQFDCPSKHYSPQNRANDTLLNSCQLTSFSSV